jgi:sugar/nucleoside kinase (ribokinase family)
MANRVLVIGDVIDDIIVRPIGPIRVNTDTTAHIEKTLGGSASNVASWLAHLGTDVDFIGCVAESDLDRNMANFENFKVRAILQVSKTKPTGSLVVLVEDQNRSMLTDRGANQELNFDLITDSQLDVGLVYLSGYALLGQPIDSVNKLFERVKKAGGLIAIDPGSTGFITDYGVEKYREILLKADLLFPNQEEADLLELNNSVPLTVVTKGPLGAVAIFKDGSIVESAAKSVETIDPTGAGDAFCGGFLAHLVQSADFNLLTRTQVEMALEAGIQAGSRAVGIIGARP